MTTAYSSLLARSPISLGEGYVNPEITDRDREISLICWGFTLGFGFLTVWKAVKQTLKVNRNCRLRSMYLWLVWADICGSFGFGISAWFYMQGHVKPGWVCSFLSSRVQFPPGFKTGGGTGRVVAVAHKGTILRSVIVEERNTWKKHRSSTPHGDYVFL